jgi:hypothetical protein
MSDGMPPEETYNGLPKYMIVPQDSGCAEMMERATDDRGQAEEIAQSMARQYAGTFVAVYQRVVLIRKRC